MVTPTPEMCIACKGGRNLCGEPCILLAKIDRRLPQLRITSQDIQGTSPPSVFVGRYGYPNVSAGPLLPPLHLEHPKAASLDDPAAWTHGSIEEVLGMRSSLLRTRARVRVHDARRPPPILGVTQELALAARPVDAEVHLVKRPNLELVARVDDTATAMGPSVEADRARLVENAPVPRLVDRLFEDTHAKAATSVTELYQGGLTPYKIEPMLSLGLLGVPTERRLVPTRWSITATDDILGRQLVPRVLEQPSLDRVEVYATRLHGNEFHVLLLPTGWSFDMIEVWMKGAMWALETSPFIEDWEDWRGRKGYASHITGAYYAARLSVLEHLTTRRRQAAAFVYREITPDYWAPLGVWVIREAVKLALQSQPISFETTSDAIAYTESRTRRKGWARASKLLGDLRGQRRITEYVT